MTYFYYNIHYYNIHFYYKSILTLARLCRLWALRIENPHTQIALFSKKIRQRVEQMPFFENTEILRDVQVLDHILTVEIKTHFILNLPRPKSTTAKWQTPAQPGLLYRWDLQGGGCH
jgi:hypothetical protein